MNQLSLVTIKESDLSKDQINAITLLNRECFSDVTDKEALEDFYDPPVARILAYVEERIVGVAVIHLKKLTFSDKEIVFGGPAGFCVVSTMRQKGVGSALCEQAMKYLKDNDCDVAFLSVDKTSNARFLYRKYGFVDLPVYYSWTKSNGEIGKDNDGMLAPVNNQQLFEEIMDLKETLYVGKGYW